MVIKKKNFIPYQSLLGTSLVDEEHLLDVGLATEAFKPITRLLGRIPNKIELALIGALWSERCCEKSTRAHLSKLASSAPTPLVSNDCVIQHKLKSVCFFEQSWLLSLSALIGDLVASGGELFALAHSFFLPAVGAEAPQDAMRAIAHYCNELGIPSLKSDIALHASPGALASFSALSLLTKPCPEKAWGAKNRIFLVGQTCEDFSFDPLVHKRLFALCHTLIARDVVIGCANISVAGIAHAAFRLASHGASGLLLHLDELPQKNACSLEQHLLSESPGRMLMVVSPTNVAEMKELSHQFNIFCADIGVVNNDGFVRIMHEGKEMVHMGATMLLENAPRLRLKYHSVIPRRANPSLKDQLSLSLRDCLHKAQQDFLLQRNTLASSFDAYLGLNTQVAKDEADAAVIDVPQAGEHVAFAIVADSELIGINAHDAAKRAFLSAALQLAAQGASMQGISCALSAGLGEQETVMTTIKQVIDATAECAAYFKVPVLSASTALAHREPSYAGLTLAAFGVTEMKRSVRFGNAKNGDLLVMLGQMPADFLGIEGIFEKACVGNGYSWDLASLERLMTIIRHCVQAGLSSSVSVVGRGGFFKCLLSIMAKTSLGLKLDFGPEWLAKELVLSLLSEESPRVLLALPPHQINALRTMCAHKAAVYTLGTMGGDRLAIYHQGELIYEAK